MVALVLTDRISQQSTHSKKYTTLVTQYGDGYIQRASDGINTEQEMWNLVYDNLDRTEYGTLMTFLNTVGMFDTIEWAPTIEDWTGSPIETKKWIVDPETDIQITNKTGDFYDVAFTLKRVYDL